MIGTLLGAGRRITTVADDTNVVNFPPPLTEGEKEWEQRLVELLRSYLPDDQPEEAAAILAVMREAVERRSSGQRTWERARLAAYLLGMFPEDYRAAHRIVSKLSCEDDEQTSVAAAAVVSGFPPE